MLSGYSWPNEVAAHQVHAIGYGVGEDWGVPAVAGGKESGEVIVVGQVRLVVVPHGAGSVGVELLGDGAGGIEEAGHAERAWGKSSGRGPGGVAPDQRCVVMVLVPRGREVFRVQTVASWKG